MLGNGIYNVPSDSGRYTKFTGSMGPPKLIAQLEVTYADGSREIDRHRRRLARRDRADDVLELVRRRGLRRAP